MTITKNINTDYGCPTNGSVNARPYFLQFKADAAADTNATLNINAGTYDISGAVPHADKFMFRGIPNLVVNGTGATFTGNVVFFGAEGIVGDGHTALTETVSAGAKTVRLLTLADASKFVVNSWALMTGFDIQGGQVTLGGYGFPPNHVYYEYVYITNITGSSITFRDRLRYSYDANWPAYDNTPPFTFGPAQGGPAMLYAIDLDWNLDHTYNGFTVDTTTSPSYTNGRIVRFNNMTVTGSYGIVPSQNRLFHATGCTMSSSDVEVDKYITEMIYDNCVCSSFDHQTASPDLEMFNNCTLSSIQGSGKRLVLNNCTLSNQFRPGAWAYGASSEVTAINTSFTNVSFRGVVNQGLAEEGVQVTYDFVGPGILRQPNSRGASVFVPGAHYLFSGQHTGGGFKVTHITKDSTYTYIHTDWPYADFPNIPRDSRGRLTLNTHPMPLARFTNCTASGSDSGSIANLSLPGSYNRPLYSYFKKTYTAADMVGLVGSPELWGNVSSISFNVTTPYTGVQSTCLWNGMSFFNVFQVYVPSTNTNTTSYHPVINLKTAGERIITPAGVTFNGAPGSGSGDSGLTLPDPACWFGGALSAGCTQDIAAEVGVGPTLVVEIYMDQGVVNPNPLVRKSHGRF